MSLNLNLRAVSMYRKSVVATVGAVFLLTACAPVNNATQPPPISAQVADMAQKGQVSRAALAVQANSTNLNSLAQQQTAAAKRSSDYGTQGAVAGAIVGGLLGYLACANCSNDKRAAAMIAGAGGGGLAGNALGTRQADTQNTAAANENALKERLRLASQQLTQARDVTKAANRVLADHNKTLTQLQAQVRAGKATNARLETARANAAADAVVLQGATKSLTATTASLRDNADQDASGQLSAVAANTQKELDQTSLVYSRLVSGINSSAL